MSAAAAITLSFTIGLCMMAGDVVRVWLGLRSVRSRARRLRATQVRADIDRPGRSTDLGSAVAHSVELKPSRRINAS